MVVPHSRPFRSGQIPGPPDSPLRTEFGGLPSISPIGPEDSAALASLKTLVATGDHRLDTMLATITDAARQLTGASGAALAMWKDGAMICRARSGDMAPPLGAKLSLDSGISGECLRAGAAQNCRDTENDPLVDVDVCRALGLRSIVALPIQGWRGINGILEVFSSMPGAFTEQNLATLQQLAGLAERARASQPHGATAAPARSSSPAGHPQSSGILPASDRVGDVALAFVDRRVRPVVAGVIGLGALALLALVVWLGWRGPSDGLGKRSARPSTVSAAAPVAASVPDPRPPDSDRVWKANPGGETLFASNGKPAAGAPVVFASRVEIEPKKAARPQPNQSPLLADLANKVAADTRVPKLPAENPAVTKLDAARPSAVETDLPPLTGEVGNSSALNGVLSAKASVPALAVATSGGVTGGELVHRVSPIYPAQARLLRLEGRVVLAATVAEDGRVRDVALVQGPPILAASAIDAVKHWRYRPFLLDGKPVKNSVQINVDFKYPSDSSR